ncbi:hypothetical protein ASD21_00580 [Caulobacter sp. Root1455]|nr:hypothetical protein ASD21_00580 [Caulobacter sp. Root1455]
MLRDELFDHFRVGVLRGALRDRRHGWGSYAEDARQYPMALLIRAVETCKLALFQLGRSGNQLAKKFSLLPYQNRLGDRLHQFNGSITVERSQANTWVLLFRIEGKFANSVKHRSISGEPRISSSTHGGKMVSRFFC